MASKADGRQLGQPLLQRRQGPLAQRAAGLAEDVLGALEIQVGRTPRQREQAAAGRPHARAQPGAQPLARLGGQRGPHHPPGLVGLAVDQAPAGGRVGQLAHVHAPAGRLPAQDLDGGVDRRHDPPASARIAVFGRGARPRPASPNFGRRLRGRGLRRHWRRHRTGRGPAAPSPKPASPPPPPTPAAASTPGRSPPRRSAAQASSTTGAQAGGLILVPPPGRRRPDQPPRPPQLGAGAGARTSGTAGRRLGGRRRGTLLVGHRPRPRRRRRRPRPRRRHLRHRRRRRHRRHRRRPRPPGFVALAAPTVG